MEYAVDCVINTIKKISDSEPILFQRDGSLYVVSPEGFGQVTYGLHDKLMKVIVVDNKMRGKHGWREIDLQPEITEAENAILERYLTIRYPDYEIPGNEYFNLKRSKFLEKYYKNIAVFKKEEKPYIKAISFGPDSPDPDTFTLEEMAETYRKLAELPDDGKIHIVIHKSGYLRNPGYGYSYAPGGIGEWVKEARLMEKNRYLKLIREIEDEQVSAIKGSEELVFPDISIFTSLLKVTAPRKGKFYNKKQAWDEKTKLKQSYNLPGQEGIELARGEGVLLSDDALFDVFVEINPGILPGPSQENFKSKKSEIFKKLNKQLNIVYSNMPEEFIEKINNSYNSAGK